MPVGCWTRDMNLLSFIQLFIRLKLGLILVKRVPSERFSSCSNSEETLLASHTRYRHDCNMFCIKWGCVIGLRPTCYSIESGLTLLGLMPSHVTTQLTVGPLCLFYDVSCVLFCWLNRQCNIGQCHIPDMPLPTPVWLQSVKLSIIWLDHQGHRSCIGLGLI